MAQSSSLFLATLLFLMISIFSQTNAFSMKMIPIDSPHLQIFPQNLTVLDRHNILSNISMSRAMRVMNKSPNAISSDLYRALSGYYITQLAFGNGGATYSPLLLLDTGSDETWVQCEGCNPCFEYNGRPFRYMDSPTYGRMNIHDQRCVPQKSFEGSCGFEIQYSQSRSVGFVGTDTFYFRNSRTRKVEGYENLAFGCALMNYNVAFGDNTGSRSIIAGIHGIAPGPRSFLNQLDAQIQGRFSYCIPSWAEPSRTAVSTIHFGEDAEISGGEGRPVQVISMNAALRFHLFLDGISVDGTKLAIDPSIFELNERYTKGFFIDSGAPYTVLARSAYDPLREAMVGFFSKYGWEIHPGLVFDMCYATYPSEEQSFPSVVFHFIHNKEGGEKEVVDMVLDKDNMFQQFLIDGKVGFCTMVLAAEDPGPCLFGAFQHANFKVLHDVRNNLFSFVPERCHGG